MLPASAAVLELPGVLTTRGVAVALANKELLLSAYSCVRLLEALERGPVS